ncbi:MAG: accessory factor UbiK family protein [Bdellovibrionales bacterium]|jgi:BMFP domain-containing protein YqiC
MKKKQSGLDDLMALAETAFSVLLGAQKEVGAHLSGKREAIVCKLDLVTHDEFDVAFAMLKKIRVVQDDLDRRLKALEGKKPVSRAQKKPASKQIRAKK